MDQLVLAVLVHAGWSKPIHKITEHAKENYKCDITQAYSIFKMYVVCVHIH